MSVTTQDMKYVAFQLENEYYAIDVQRVQEVFVPTSITPIPQSSEHIAGVINYRGSILTVVDIKKRLLIKPKAKKKSSVDEFGDEDEDRLYVIITKTGDSPVGLLVDSVESVISISQENVRQTLELISGKNSAFMSGVARTDLGLTIILQIETILSEYDIKEAEKLAQLRLDTQKILGESEDDELVVSSLVDLDEDDLSAADKTSDARFKKVDVDSSGGLDLNNLSKAELLKIAIEMDIPDVNTKTSKNDLLSKIQEKMG